MSFIRLTVLVCLHAVLILLFSACSKDDDGFRKDKSVDGQFRGSIKFTCTHLYKLSPQIDSLADNTAITLYRSQEDLNFERSAVVSDNSDTTGIVTLSQLPDTVYYYKAIYRGMEKEEKIRLNGEVNFVEVIFY